MLTLVCPGCRRSLQVRPENAGRPVRCPACSETISAETVAAVGAAPTQCAPDGAASVSSPSVGPYPFLGPPGSADEIGRFGGYGILRLLGRGGMGLVFEARDPGLDRRVALKVLGPETAAHPTGRGRFLREARAAAALQHDHVVTIHQVGEDRGLPFFVMPLLRGETLDARLGRVGRLPLPETLRIGREIAEGLAAAHAAKLIHRDIKPANVWLEGEPGASATGGRVKLLDFGLARPQTGDSALTRLGTLLGTPGYIAPEQLDGAVDHRADLFALGCVLYLLTTGQLPFGGDGMQALRVRTAKEPPPAPHTLNRTVPPALSALILELLARRPEDRPASASVVAARLRSLEVPPVHVTPAPPPAVSVQAPPPLPKPPPVPRVRAARSARHAPEPAPSGWRLWMLVPTILAAGVLVVFAVWLGGRLRRPKARPAEETVTETAPPRARMPDPERNVKPEETVRVASDRLVRMAELVCARRELENASQAGLLTVADEQRLSESRLAEADEALRAALPATVQQLRTSMHRSRTEAAINGGLRWLALHQAADGHWSLNKFRDHARTEPLPNGQLHPDTQCTGLGSHDSDVAATAFALLAFLGAGHTHQAAPGREAPYQKAVAAGLLWLLNQQGQDGVIGAVSAQNTNIYAHAAAAFALCEAYRLTADPNLKEPARRALTYLVGYQHKEGGGWRYARNTPGDMSITGWVLLALESGQKAGIFMQPEVLAAARRFVDSCEDANNKGCYGYIGGTGRTPGMTAIGIRCQLFFGADGRNAKVRAGVDYLRSDLPNRYADLYSAYQVTQALSRMDAETWRFWDEGKEGSSGMCEFLLKSQDDGTLFPEQRGSWYLTAGTAAGPGGRHLCTTLALLCLETSYRKSTDGGKQP
jgi:hypothetical protein